MFFFSFDSLHYFYFFGGGRRGGAFCHPKNFFLRKFFCFFLSFAFYHLLNFALIWFEFKTSGVGSSAGSSSSTSKAAAWDGCVPVVESCVPVFMPIHAIRKVHTTPFSCSPEICISLLCDDQAAHELRLSLNRATRGS